MEDSRTAPCNQVQAPSECGALQHMAAVQTLIQESGWTALVQSEHAESLKQHCCLCGRWIVDATALEQHIKGARIKYNRPAGNYNRLLPGIKHVSTVAELHTTDTSFSAV